MGEPDIWTAVAQPVFLANAHVLQGAVAGELGETASGLVAMLVTCARVASGLCSTGSRSIRTRGSSA